MKLFRTLLTLVGVLATAVAVTAVETPAPATPTAAAPKVAQPKAKVMIGSVTCFAIRECAMGQTPQQRSDHITDVFNKYLGGRTANFSTKPSGKNTLITMNKEPLILVTALDAKAAGAKNVAQLTVRWKTVLAKAFNETKAVK